MERKKIIIDNFNLLILIFIIKILINNMKIIAKPIKPYFIKKVRYNESILLFLVSRPLYSKYLISKKEEIPKPKKNSFILISLKYLLAELLY